jgi:hypothetical protein
MDINMDTDMRKVMDVNIGRKRTNHSHFYMEMAAR